jgi:hypothetical protein
LTLVTWVDGCTSSSGAARPSDDAGSLLSDASLPNEDGGAIRPSDGGAGACSPASVQSYTPHWTPPTPHQSSCSAAQIVSYATCLAPPSDPNSPACASWLGADASAENAECRTCFAASSATASTWGPLIDAGSTVEINVAGCLALVGGDPEGAGCAGQYQALQGCESLACATNCANASSDALAACVTAADGTACSNYVAAAACVSEAGAAAACFGPPGATYAQVLTAVGTAFCLASPDGGAPASDGGAPASDAGAASGDAGDVGDAGDAVDGG